MTWATSSAATGDGSSTHLRDAEIGIDHAAACILMRLSQGSNPCACPPSAYPCCIGSASRPAVSSCYNYSSSSSSSTLQPYDIPSAPRSSDSITAALPSVAHLHTNIAALERMAAIRHAQNKDILQLRHDRVMALWLENTG
ncbi:hypothetical protein HDU84_003559 [Entophlyctis sp. JEL0112]|nr:hypothetical protein HDU84_003559 [Entophlyctis sp. JEL0112]